MRYRGGGIGHKYMREIEEIYENMSRERIHHKERRQHTPSLDGTMDTSSSKDATNPNSTDCGSDDENEPEAGRDNGSDSGSDSDSDYQYIKTDSGDSGSSGGDGSDDSDSEDGPCESYGFGAL